MTDTTTVQTDPAWLEQWHRVPPWERTQADERYLSALERIEALGPDARALADELDCAVGERLGETELRFGVWLMDQHPDAAAIDAKATLLSMLSSIDDSLFSLNHLMAEVLAGKAKKA